jgi:dUTP pyrophosphatase
LERITVKVKRLHDIEDIALPVYESQGSSGMDIRAAVKERVLLKPGEIKCFTQTR